MTLVDQPGDDINVSPIAFNDSYNAVGNTTLTVSAANGVLGAAVAGVHETASADMEFFTQTFGTGANNTKVVAGTFATTAGGSVTIAADGGFTYTPPTGFEGTGATADTFTYTLRDAGLDGTFGNTDDLTGSGTVTIDVGPVIWYIDASAPGGGNGTKDSPFNSIAAFNAVNDGVGSHPAAGDIVFLRSGTYSEADGINLLEQSAAHRRGRRPHHYADGRRKPGHDLSGRHRHRSSTRAPATASTSLPGIRSRVSRSTIRAAPISPTTVTSAR